MSDTKTKSFIAFEPGKLDLVRASAVNFKETFTVSVETCKGSEVCVLKRLGGIDGLLIFPNGTMERAEFYGDSLKERTTVYVMLSSLSMGDFSATTRVVSDWVRCTDRVDSRIPMLANGSVTNSGVCAIDILVPISDEFVGSAMRVATATFDSDANVTVRNRSDLNQKFGGIRVFTGHSEDEHKLLLPRIRTALKASSVCSLDMAFSPFAEFSLRQRVDDEGSTRYSISMRAYSPVLARIVRSVHGISDNYFDVFLDVCGKLNAKATKESKT